MEESESFHRVMAEGPKTCRGQASSARGAISTESLQKHEMLQGRVHVPSADLQSLQTRDLIRIETRLINRHGLTDVLGAIPPTEHCSRIADVCKPEYGVCRVVQR